MKKKATVLIASIMAFCGINTDPPRAGMHPDVINVILNAAPKRIVYVSCNPATQARDLQLMDDHYKVAAVRIAGFLKNVTKVSITVA